MMLSGQVAALFKTPTANLGSNGGAQSPSKRRAGGHGPTLDDEVSFMESWLSEDGKDYGPRVRLWEELTGHPAPSPTEPGEKTEKRLSARFSEWMMGHEPGWITDTPGLSRPDHHTVIGGGVVQIQAEQAFRFLLEDWPEPANGMDDMNDMNDETKADKPRGTCTGCKFEYQLSTARSGEFKGELVTRKHNSRTGPGLCEGASRPPAAPEQPAELPHDTGSAPFTDPEPAAPAPGPVFSAGFDSEGSCGHDIQEGDAIRADGEGGYMCADCAEPEPVAPDRAPAQDAPFADPAYEPSGAPVPGVDTITFVDPVPVSHPQSQDPADHPPAELTPPPMPSGGILAAGENQYASTVPTTTLPLTSPLVAESFTDPAPMPAELPPVSGQPEPDRDRWGRYLIGGTGHTRATTFAKLGSSTYALGEWNERMLIKGLTERPDLLALAHGLDVKRDKKQLNSIADDAQTHAGNKVAANIGTAYHTFTERLDAGLMTLADVPVQYRARCEQYLDAIRAHGLVTRREWIERTTAVRADQVSAPAPVAGTLDRIFQLPNGELVIGDLKTGSDLSYSFAEIAVQLAVYAHGCNTFGLFDWNTKTWGPAVGYGPGEFPVRTDYAIVMHLPADGDGCILYRVDLIKGWEYAQVSGMVQSRQKDKTVAGVLVPGSLGPVTAPQPVPVAAPAAPEATFGEMERALGIIQEEMNPAQLMQLYGYAEQSGKFSPGQLKRIFTECHRRWEALNIPC